MVVHKRGQFIYRMNGRDRQKSASYYTPEVLTRTTVKYTLKHILERIPAGEMEARELLRLKILEPAMGAAAFHNEVINQLAGAYLDARQQELGQKINPGDYREQLQRVKAYIANNNVYGVDLNPTAVELGKLSLWLNVIHQEMETPFFGYRLGVGNAVVGCWLKAYRAANVLVDKGRGKSKKQWWKQAPVMLPFGKKGIRRKSDQIYHFLLPDPGMVAAADHKLLKQAYPEETRAMREWRKAFCAPLSRNEYPRLQAICRRIDALLEEHYQFQAQINACTQSAVSVWGATDLDEQCALDLQSYDEKERLAQNRNKTNAPYFKLKMVMDYWCALWYWDVREATELPSRQQWYEDLIHILDIDLEEEMQRGEAQVRSLGGPRSEQGDIFREERQLTLSTYRRESEQRQVAETVVEYTNRQDSTLFKSTRNRLVHTYAQQYPLFPLSAGVC